MFSISQNSYQMQGFDFSMQTSSGDKIDLSMYSSKKSDISLQKDKNILQMSLSLKEEFGYSFSYSGNGIDEQDKKEIQEALKKIEPFLGIFGGDKTDLPQSQKTNLAFDMNNLLPKPKDENHKNFIKDSVIDKMDEMLKAFDAIDEMTKLAKDVFDELSKQMEQLSIYA